MDWELITQLLVAGGVGGVVTNYFSTTSGRRDARRNLLDQMRKLSEPEGRHKPDEEAAFLDAALSAGAPRGLANYYLRSRVRFVLSEASARALETYPGRVAEGVTLSQAMDDMMASSRARAKITATLTQFAWRPWWTKATWRLSVHRAVKVVNRPGWQPNQLRR